ncbi:gamma-glutamylcyclotransferase (GGCT)/AIG2-like uncharacterized protein YtfP [Tamilnaduibacter salinus]|uniref:Gamma-glutamylcyclotransferase (GGCT)/AIG2-like uncharacterized protein YtfP n=1 Tax=Tamilnaduibacter salinus TaxID=1484056 RepID=A0A2U1CXD4_9GAMM|nr:gamma-glutamylcyclotransferase [Tamilnaduibacter salinus]PVY76803.1 gamma-glutamylcyclotransferase (GGCT)/AIG2-like uncharacterized protein YtfP [Tamilnaduibacter salinus]
MGAYRIAVYGTLKAGRSNHHYMANARYLGEDWFSDIVLYDLGPYPGARREPSNGIRVEVYAVDDATFGEVDALEGYRPEAPNDGLYHRRLVSTRHGMAWLYLYNHSVEGCPRLDAGDWGATPEEHSVQERS